MAEFKILPGGVGADVTIDSSRLDSHKASDDYLYYLVFGSGWHGGARPSVPGGRMPDDAEGNPFPGSYDQPYYRKPVPHFDLWGRPAVRWKYQESPRERFFDMFNTEMASLDNWYRKRRDEIDTQCLNTVNKLMEKYNVKK